MKAPRCSGLLLHPTSLPSPSGIGDLGDPAHHFLEQLASAGQRLWQMLPLGPTGYGDSPYQLFSAFAGNPVLIGLEPLVRDGLLLESDLAAPPQFPGDTVDFPAATAWKIARLNRAAANFHAGSAAHLRPAFLAFCAAHAAWLDDYALFIALKTHFGVEHVWTEWDPAVAQRQTSALSDWRTRLQTEIERQKFWQFAFFRQWDDLRRHASALGVSLMGDIPIYVAHDSADVWSNPGLFLLDAHGHPLAVAGVPPDYFSATGQLWGNPIYRWDTLAGTGFAWWIERFRATFQLFDVVRLDHFRGFEAFWQVPAGEATAMHGQWIKAPGPALFRALQTALGDLAIVAENLGVITPEVEAIRAEFGFPGMAVLQFAFGNDPQAPDFQPHNYVRNLFAYTGTHDNDTAVGWWRSKGGDSVRSDADIAREKAFALRYLGVADDRDIQWSLIRTLLASVANTAIVPMQDVLGLSSESRMNMPGKLGGNWGWRMKPGAFTPELQARLKEYAATYGRV